MEDNDTGQKTSNLRPDITIKNQAIDVDCEYEHHIIARTRQSIEFHDISFGLGNQSTIRLFLTYYRILEYHKKSGDRHPVCFMSNEELMSKEWANISKNTFYKAKQKLVSLALIDVRTVDTFQSGKISNVYSTDAGWAKLYEIRSKIKKNEQKEPVEPVEKKEHFSYTDEDVENAKFWFKSLRKFWRDYPGKLTQIGDWKEKWQPRANGMRKAREKADMTPEGFRKILETIVKSDEAGFFFKTVIAPDAFCKKWKNGLTVAETMVDRCDDIWKKQEEQEQLQLSKEDVPVYPDKNGNDVEDVNVTNVWDSMWDVIGNHLSRKFKSKEQVNNYWDALIVLCEQIADRLHFRPGRIVLRDQHLSGSLRQDEMPNEASYFYFLLDKYSGWNGHFTPEMIWSPWFQFWKKIWKLDHGDPTDADMEQFIVEQFTEER